jgi:hypothetical protein
MQTEKNLESVIICCVFWEKEGFGYTNCLTKAGKPHHKTALNLIIIVIVKAALIL